LNPLECETSSKARDQGSASIQEVIGLDPDDCMRSRIFLTLLDSNTTFTCAFMPTVSAFDRHLWGEGRLLESYRVFGAHPNRQGTWFRVWAPRADEVALIGDFNNWDRAAHSMRAVGTGMERFWEIYVRGARVGQRYKFSIRRGPWWTDKSDPFAFEMEPPDMGGHGVAGLSGIIADQDFAWSDDAWMATRPGPESLTAAVSIYEVHLGSWRRKGDGMSLSYREMAEPLAAHALDMGFTHVELLPVQEHPYYGSWGYQVIGPFAPTFRYGSPADFKYLINYLHEKGIGVLLDWVPAHFATDPQGLVDFDGEPLFEYEEPVMRHHPDWGTLVFDYTRPQVRNYLLSNALFWLDEFHIDGLRFDAVASMLYRDYSRGEEWTPNKFGGRENLEAMSLLKEINETVFTRFPNAIMVAEESTAWPGVSHPTYTGGLGFLYKWNMGWMHDSLEFFKEDPINRRYHFHNFTFPLVYAWAENYMLSLSHDEVVHGKGSMFGKMPGDDWQKAANLRLLYGHMFGHPGKKLLFMGCEFGQRGEWNHDAGLEWGLLDEPLHQGIAEWVRTLNNLYKEFDVLQYDEGGGFYWIDFSDLDNTVASYVRHRDGKELIFIFNFTPVPRLNYRQGVPHKGTWTVRLSSDDLRFGGSGAGSMGPLEARQDMTHGQPASLQLDLPPLGLLILEKAPDIATKQTHPKK